MKRKHVILTGVVVIFIAVAAILAFSRHANETTPRGAVAACLPAKPGLTVDTADRTNIEEAAAGQLMTVPAGTQTTVNISNYDQSTAAGSELYPKNYGTYNFTAKRITTTASNQLTWKITSFVACKK